ncbi:hypothetical protein A0H81_14145 [Grifola frondosa]|uniref:Uncharacterized protein n=1 Tax=Grifola frondosa TaxID=5627 RepID=A0A1C7LPU8_GRIFR|nr:hypothetical protein A0H81_14145 [Grifola frondosa]
MEGVMKVMTSFNDICKVRAGHLEGRSRSFLQFRLALAPREVLFPSGARVENIRSDGERQVHAASGHR